MKTMDHTALRQFRHLLTLDFEQRKLLSLAIAFQRNVSVTLRDTGLCSLQFLLHTQGHGGHYLDLAFSITPEIRHWAIIHNVDIPRRSGIRNPWSILFVSKMNSTVPIRYQNNQGKVVIERQLKMLATG